MLALAFAAYAIAWGAALLGISAAAIAVASLWAGHVGCYEAGRAVTRFAGTGMALAVTVGSAIYLHLWT